jgi:DNA repair exonuclease SbcCD ATPase subunit
VRIEISRPKQADQKKPDVVLSPEERALLEAEKAQLLETLQPARKRAAKVVEPEPAPRDAEPAPEVIPPESVCDITVPDVAAAITERKELESQLKNLEAQIAAARLREKQAQQAAIVAQQQKAQAQGTQQLAPLKPRLERHLAEVSRIQTKWGPTLKDFARSMASDADPQVRRQISEVYRSAAPLGQQLGDARHTIESALRGLTLAMQSSQAHVHSQAATLADAALAISLLALETECKTLVQLRNELRPGHVVHSVTPDRTVPSSLTPQPFTTSADFGPSLV